MISILYTRAFLRKLNKLDSALAEEIVEKVELFKDRKNHKSLKVHKLHGKLSDKYAFSVNCRVKVIFQYSTGDKDEVYVVAVDTHDIYR